MSFYRKNYEKYKRRYINEKYVIGNVGNNFQDIGRYGLARGKPVNSFNIKKDIITYQDSLEDKESNNKVLKIDNLDDFDLFTQKYGKLVKFNDGKILIIRWDKVKEDFAGIFINNGLNADRYESALFNGKIYKSWWINDMRDNNIFIFEKSERDVYDGVMISKPFKGKKYIKNHFPENHFTDYFNGKKEEDRKILILNSIDSFDEFTNEYGELFKKDNIRINWDRVSEDFKGFYIDNDKIPDRLKHCFFKGKKYQSWVVKFSNCVYIFL